MTNPHFTTWLDHMMSIRGWSQSELARQTGVHQTQISRWCRGIVSPDRAHRTLLAHTFGVPEADVHMLVGDKVGAREAEYRTATAASPERHRAHQLVDVMDPDIIADILPVLERLMRTGAQS